MKVNRALYGCSVLQITSITWVVTNHNIGYGTSVTALNFHPHEPSGHCSCCNLGFCIMCFRGAVIPSTVVMNDTTFGEERVKIMPVMYKYLSRHFLIPKKIDDKSSHFLKGFLVISLYGSLPICGLLYIFDIKMRNVAVETAEDLSGVISIFCQCLLLFWALFCYKRFNTVAENLLNFDCFGKPDDFEKLERRLQTLITFFYYCGTGSAVVFGLLPMLEIGRCKEYNEFHDLHETCGFRFPLPFLRTTNYPYSKILFLVYQAIALLTAAPAMSILPFLVYGFHEHIATRMKDLRKHLKILSPFQSNQNEQIIVLIRYHQYVIRLMNEANHLTSLPLCMHVFVTSSMITLIIHAGFRLVWKSPISVIMHGLIWLAALLLNSLGGQRIIDESTNFANEIYTGILWYKFNISIQKDLLLIMIRAQKPLVASTGPFGHMMLPLFLMVMKGVYSFLIASLIQEYRSEKIF